MKLLPMVLVVSAFVSAGCRSDPRDAAFPSVDQKLRSLGLNLTFDLVDGGYTVHATEADDDAILKAVGSLKELQQGTSITELDYERRFTFFLGGTAITDKAIAEILTLQVAQVRLNDTNVTAQSLTLLQDAPHLRVLVVGNGQFSGQQLQEFSKARPEIVVMDAE